MEPAPLARREMPVVDRGDAFGCRAELKSFEHQRAAGARHRLGAAAIGEQSRIADGQRLGIARRHEQAGVAVTDRFRHAAHARGHGRPLHQQRLDRAAVVLAQRTLHRDVERGENLRHVVAAAEEHHRIVEVLLAAARDQALTIAFAGGAPSRAGQHEARVWRPLTNQPRRGDEILVTLDAASADGRRRLPVVTWRIEVGDEADQRNVWRDAQLAPHAFPVDARRVEAPAFAP